MATFYTGNTGQYTSGPHVDFRVWDVNKGGFTDPTRFTSRMRVGDGLLTDQFNVTSGYGMRTHPTRGGRRMHDGIDYGTPVGTAITIDGGKFLTTFNDPGGGITSQYAITGEDGNPYEILLMHGSDQNKILSEAAVTTGQPIGASSDPSTPKPDADNQAPPVLTPEQVNAKYDKLRMAGDIFEAEEFGMAQHKRLFNKT